ncbi:MAG: 30S ribosomal protein S2 [Microthrixaceae bacterium]
MAPVVTMKELLEAGVHFGHQTRRWNPKMQRFIYGERNGIYLIDLRQTLERVRDSFIFVRDLVADGGSVMFIGTKKQAQDSVQSYAERCGMPYVNERWLGGMLTNFETISKRISKMKEYQRMRDSGEFEAMPKKEALLLTRELAKLERYLGGIRDLESLPDAVFILDTKKEDIAVTEANKLGLPIVAVVDTNCDPDIISYVIPGNDDAIRSGSLMSRVISDAVNEGRQIRNKRGHGGASSDGGAPEAPKPIERTPEEEAAHQAAQDQARNEAAAQAAERERRLNEPAPAKAAPADQSAETVAEAAPAEEAAVEAAPEASPAEVAAVEAEDEKSTADAATTESEEA